LYGSLIIGSALDKYSGEKRFKLQSIPNSESALGPAHLPESPDQFSSILNTAISRATWAKYSSGYNAFTCFEEHSGKKYTWPLSAEIWRAFIIWCHYERKLAYNSILTYLSALKFVHSIQGMPYNHLTEDKLSSLLLSGIKHVCTTHYTKPNTRRVMTFPLLLFLGRKIADTDWPALDKQVVWTACLTAFFGTTRLGEILASAENSFSPASDLLWSDIRCSSSNSLLIHLRQPKSGMPGGEKVDLFEFPGFQCCPVKALRNLRQKQIQAGMTDESLPVFRFSSGKNLTRDLLNRTLSTLLSDICLPGKDTVTCHSFRAGIPSTLSMFPDLVTSDMIKGWGRWQTDCYKLYTRLSLLEKEQIFGKIKQALYLVAPSK